MTRRPQPVWEVWLSLPEIDALLNPHAPGDAPSDARTSARAKLENSRRLLATLADVEDRLDAIKELVRQATGGLAE